MPNGKNMPPKVELIPDPCPLDTFSNAIRECHRILGLDTPPMPTIGEFWDTSGPKLADAAKNLRNRLLVYRSCLEVEIGTRKDDASPRYQGIVDGLQLALDLFNTPSEPEKPNAPKRPADQDWGWKD